MHRVGIIPFDIKDGAVAILFVTSQTRGRWILPKGLPKSNESPPETGIREGFEEAGIKGVLLEEFPLTVPITKKGADETEAVPVTYFPLLVTEQKDDWPEAGNRQRHWALLKDAPRVTYREDYLAVIKQFEALVPWIKKAAKTHK